MPNEAAAVVYKSEEERQNALFSLPDEPPAGTTNVDAWLESVDAEKTRIEGATIDENFTAPETVADDSNAAPSGYPPAPAPATEPTVEEIIEFGKIKRSDLPEELRGYKSPGEILKQYGHARKFANTAEERLREANEKLSTYEQKVATADAAQAQINELKTQIELLRKTNATIPQTPVQRAESQSQINDLQSKIAEVDELTNQDLFDSPEALEKVKDVIRMTSGEIANAYGAAQKVQDELNKYREDNERRYAETEQRVQGYTSREDKRAQELAAKQAQKEAASALISLQDKRSELKTTKPIMAEVGQPSVENDIVNFANKFMVAKAGRHAASWDEINQVVHSYIRKDPETLAVCQSKGITPELVGTNENDIKNYAILSNIDIATRGMRINEYTGRVEQLVSPLNGKPVNFPDPETAYDYLLKISGISDQKRQQELVEAEKRGQKSLEEAASRRDSGIVNLGNDGSGSPENMGEQMSLEMAEELIGARHGQRTIDDEKMELQARNGNRSLFHLYNKGLKRLGLPLLAPQDFWPQEKNSAQ